MLLLLRLWWIYYVIYAALESESEFGQKSRRIVAILKAYLFKVSYPLRLILTTLSGLPAYSVQFRLKDMVIIFKDIVFQAEDETRILLVLIFLPLLQTLYSFLNSTCTACEKVLHINMILQ